MHCRVAVQVGSRELVGIVVDTADATGDAARLRPIGSRLDAVPLLSTELVQSLRWAASYYAYPLGEVLQSALPVALRRPDGKVDLLPAYAINQAGAAALAVPGRPTRARRVLGLLAAGPLTRAALGAELGTAAAVLRQLEREGLVDAVDDAGRTARPSLAGPPLNPEQASAFEQLAAGLEPPRFGATLLDGVTGSGKTEVYLQAIARLPRARPAGAGAGAGDRPDAADAAALPRAPGRAGARRCIRAWPTANARAPGWPRRAARRGWCVGTRSAVLHAAAARRPDRDRRGTRRPLQAAGRHPLPRARLRAGARARAGRPGRAGQRHAVAGDRCTTPCRPLRAPAPAATRRRARKPPRGARARLCASGRCRTGSVADWSMRSAACLRARRAGAGVQEPPRLRAGAAVPRLRLERPLPALRRAP